MFEKRREVKVTASCDPELARKRLAAIAALLILFSFSVSQRMNDVLRCLAAQRAGGRISERTRSGEDTISWEDRNDLGAPF
jgi:hypothetical protein